MPNLSMDGLVGGLIGLMMAFFDEHSRFQTTSGTGMTAARLNARHRAIIEDNRSLFAGKRVLDIASHDGRWSFAALHAGAQHVTGIEARSHLVKNAFANFAAYNIDPNRFEFTLGDVFEVMRTKGIYVDVVLLLGFYYHTTRHDELTALVAATGAAHVILDTEIMPTGTYQRGTAVVRLFSETTDLERNAVGPRSQIAIGQPSREAIHMLFSQHGFQMKEFGWAPHSGGPDLQDYREDRRSTFLLSRQ